MQEARNAADAQPKDVSGALERLAASRARLRSAMLPPAEVPASHRLGAGIDAIANNLLDRLKALPAVNIVIEAIGDWWSQHPLRTASHVAAATTRRLATPIAEKHPLALVAAAAGVGALLVLFRPWRWLLRPALLAGLVPAVAARAFRELPIDSLLSVFTSFGAPKARTRSSRNPVGATGAAVPSADGVHARNDPRTSAESRGETAMYP